MSTISEHNLQLSTITDPIYSWNDHGRYVEVVPVQTGWLVLWGEYRHLGLSKHIYGSRVYRDEAGVRRRLADAVLKFTKRHSEARDALVLLDRMGGLPAHRPAALKPAL